MRPTNPLGSIIEYTKGTVPFVYLITFINRKFPLVSDLKLEDFLYLSTRFSKDKPGILLKALIFRRKRYDVLLKEEKSSWMKPQLETKMTIYIEGGCKRVCLTMTC